MSKHILITAGTAHYDYLPEDQQRPKLKEVVTSITDLFTEKFGYTQVLEEIGNDPTSNDLRVKLDNWLASDERDSTDWIVFYYTGHGELIGSDSLYLLTRDYKTGRHTSTAFPISQLGEMLIGPSDTGESRRVRRFLLILDTCHSGAGAFEISSKIRNLFSQGITGGMFYLLAASFPNEEAMAGALADALIQSLQEERFTSAQQAFIYFDQLIPAINQKLRHHQIVYSPVAAPDVEPQFFPNPNHIPKLPQNLTVAEIRRAAANDEITNFWDPISRGVEVEQQTGWYFTGRERILKELSDWLEDPTDKVTQVVTGKAGSGKSAIISRIVTASDPQYRQRMPMAEERRTPRVSIDLAIHAKGKTLDEIINRFATQLRVIDTRTEVLKALQAQQEPFCVIVDALDEAREPSRIARELLEPMNAYPLVKLVVGTREEYLKELGSNIKIFRVDHPDYIDKQDLANYVELRLLALGESTIAEETPYKGKTVLARQVAEIVAENAYPNFLIARLSCENLLGLPEVVDPETLKASSFPSTIDQAFDQYLTRFGEEEEKVRNLLTALAWAEGQGLPWDNIWPPMASGLSNHNYDDEDVSWVLRHAGSFIIEGLEQGRSVYRLYHQALSDYLCQGLEEKVAHSIIVQVLIDTVPMLPGNIGRDWRLASPYILLHLAEHAANSGLLAELVLDPLYLLCADSNRLLSALIAASITDAPGKIVQLYKCIVHFIREKSIEEAASYLRLNALKRGLKDIGNHPSLLYFSNQWNVSWAHWKPEPPSTTIAKGASEITALLSAQLASRPVSILGRMDGSVEVWDIAEGSLLKSWKPLNLTYARKVALTESKSGPLLIGVWDSGYPTYRTDLGVINLSTNQSFFNQLDGGDDSAVLAMCVANRNGEMVCITAQADLRLVIWGLPTLEVVVERPQATTSNIYYLTPIQRGRESLLLSIGDHLDKFDKNQINSTIRLWSLKDLTPVWQEEPRDKGVFQHVESGIYFGRRLVLLSQDNWGPPEIWDLEQGRILFRDKDGMATSHSWFYQSGNDILLIGEKTNNLRVQRLIPSNINNVLTLDSELVSENLSITGGHFTSIFNFQGRAVFLSAVLSEVRIWDIEELLTNSILSNDLDINLPYGVFSLAAGSSNEQVLYLSTFEEVLTSDIKTSNIIKKYTFEGSGRVNSLALSPSQNTLVIGTIQGSIYVLDLLTPDSIPRLISAEKGLEKVCTIDWQSHTLIFATVKRGRGWAVRIWDLYSGEELPTNGYTGNGAYGLTSGQEDKHLRALTIDKINDKIRIAFASKYGMVMVGDWDGKEPEGFPYREWSVPNTSEEYINCLTTITDSNEVLLAAGTQYGKMAVWNFLTGEVIASHPNAHIGQIKALCSLSLSDSSRDMLVSGGDDGVVRFWTKKLALSFSIDITSPITSITYAPPNYLAVGADHGVIMLQIHNDKL